MGSEAAATALDAKVARTDTRMVIVEAFERKLEGLRAQSEAVDTERELVLRELRELRDALGDEEDTDASSLMDVRVSTDEHGTSTIRELPSAGPRSLAAAPPSRHAVRHTLGTDLFDSTWSELGDSIALNVAPHVEEHILTAWRVCAGLRSELRCTSLSAEADACAVVVHAQGQSWTSGLPTLLAESLRSRTLAQPGLRVTHVAMGTDERYYVRYSNGVRDWSEDPTTKDCSDAIEAMPTAQVSFGAHGGSYAVMYQDGSLAYAQLPPAMEAVLEARGVRDARVQDLALGPAGEWWLLFADGHSESGNLSAELSARVRTIRESGGLVTSLAFGAEGTFVLRYAKRWQAS